LHLPRAAARRRENVSYDLCFPPKFARAQSSSSEACSSIPASHDPSLSLLGKGLACSLLLFAWPLWASFTIIFNGVVTIVNTGGLVLSNPTDVAVDSTGNVNISDTIHSRILKVASDGTTSAVTITGISPVLSSPSALALDGAGNLYIADSGNARVIKVAPSGSGSVISTPSIALSSPQGVAVDVSGNLFIADTGNNRIVKVTSGGVATVLAITGLGTRNNPFRENLHLDRNVYSHQHHQLYSGSSQHNAGGHQGRGDD
jgi:NHL repeat